MIGRGHKKKFPGNIVGDIARSEIISEGGPEIVKDIQEAHAVGNERRIIQAQQQTQKRLINQKQIRALRNQYRSSAGTLLQQNPRGVSLGEATGLPSKLGTA